MGGRELASRAARLRPELPVLLASGLPNDNAAEREQLAPHQAFLQKPFTAEMLTRKVRQVLGGERTYR